MVKELKSYPRRSPLGRTNRIDRAVYDRSLNLRRMLAALFASTFFFAIATHFRIYSSIVALSPFSFFSRGLVANYGATERATTSQLAAAAPPTVHVLYALSRDKTGHLDGNLKEFETSLKSVLLNAPLESNLTIHIMAERAAYDALDHIFEETELRTWRTRNQISINIYNVEPYIKRWKPRVKAALHPYYYDSITLRNTIGAWFRLFAQEVLPDDVDHVVYLDPDVAIMANLADVWRHIDPDASFQWGENRCSGFLLMNVKKNDEILRRAKDIDMMKISKQFKNHQSEDELIFVAIHATSPEVVTLLPPELDVSLALHLWKQQGMLHSNGLGKSDVSAFERDEPEEHPRTIGRTQYLYYMRVPWTWARFMARTRIGDGDGYPLLVVRHRSKRSELIPPVYCMFVAIMAGGGYLVRRFRPSLSSRVSLYR